MKYNQLKNNGFIPPVIDKTHYVFGSNQMSFKVIQPDGDWSNVIPEEEKQYVLNFDTFNCVSFNTLNQIEMYMNKVFNEKINYSDRWLGIIAGTNPERGGNDPQTVYEAIRKYGLIPEEMLPFSEDLKTVEEYYSFKGADSDKCYACLLYTSPSPRDA